MRRIPMPVVVDEKQSRTIGFWTPLRLALFFWLSMVAATVVPLLLIVQRSWLAIATVGVAIFVGAGLFAFVRAEAKRTAPTTIATPTVAMASQDLCTISKRG